MIDFTLGNNKISMLPVFASNLTFVTLDDEFNIIDKDSITFRPSQHNKDQTSEISESMYVLEDYPKLGFKILEIFNQYTDQVLQLRNRCSFSTSWFTKMKPDDFCRFHYHTNAFYSGLFYFDDYTETSGDICFLNPLNQFNNFGVGSRKGKGNNYNAKEYLVTPQKNMLLFFPSYLWHTILNNHSDKPRYSLAFNLIPLGQYGSGDSTYNTEWFEK